MGTAGITVNEKHFMKKYLMLFGTIAVIVYIAHIITGGIIWKNYSHLQQPISDLTAENAPGRNLMLLFTFAYGILALVFAVSFTLLESKRHHKYVFWGGLAFIALHLISLFYNFFPEDLPGSPRSFGGTMHMVITALVIPFTIAAPLLTGMGLSKERGWQRMGAYSILTAVMILFFGAATGIFYAKEYRYFGLVERLNIGALQLWTFILSVRAYHEAVKQEKAGYQKQPLIV